jgi:rhodanese-related sulfurtransferase
MEDIMHREIQAEKLKSWYDEKKEMVVIDARSKEYFEGTLLPQAKWVTCEAGEKEILAAVPSKSSLVVLYCASKECPASGMLYDKMAKMGYTNLYAYHGGLKEWQEKKFPTVKKK